MSTSTSPYNRILLKLSGESFAAPGQRGIAMQEVVDIATQTYRAAQLGVQIGIVIGGDRFVHAPNSRGVVRVDSLTSAYWGGHVVGARRMSGS